MNARDLKSLLEARKNAIEEFLKNRHLSFRIVVFETRDNTTVHLLDKRAIGFLKEIKKAETELRRILDTPDLEITESLNRVIICINGKFDISDLVAKGF